MEKPKLCDFNLTDEKVKKQSKNRILLTLVFTPVAFAIGLANYLLWLQSRNVIGDWSLLGLILTLFGLLPAAFTYALLDKFVGAIFYGSLSKYELAKKQYDVWFVRTQLLFWDSLTGREFEFEVCNLLNRAGYTAKVTPASGDKGVDVFLHDGTVIQCKAHKSRISPAVVRELYGVLQHFNAPRGILISKNGFTKGVYEFVRGKNIELWDVGRLIKMQKALD